MRFAEYPFYCDVYRGSLGFEKFDALISGASCFIDEITFGRLRGKPITDDVKSAVCAVVDRLAEDDGERSVASEKIGNVSVTYNCTQSKSDSVLSIAKRYIKDKSLFYRGV